MGIFEWLVSILIVALLIYSLAKPYLQRAACNKLEQSNFFIEEEPIENPAPKKRKPYKKRKPKNDKGEK